DQPCPRIGPGNRHAVPRLPVTAKENGEGFEFGRPRKIGDKVRNGQPQSLGLRLDVIAGCERTARSLAGCQDKRVMLCCISALTVKKASVAGIGAQALHHRSGGMRHVIVKRGAEEGEAARYSQRRARAEAEKPPRQLGNTGKTAVKLVVI